MTLILPSGSGHWLVARGSRMLFKATAATTGGRFSLMDRTIPPHGRAPAAHRHPATLEMFMVLEGTLDFVLDGQRTAVDAGGTHVNIPTSPRCLTAGCAAPRLPSTRRR
jgi:Cupin domain